MENGVYFLRGNNVVQGNTLEGLPGWGGGYGDSYLLDPNGQLVACAGFNNECLLVCNIDLERTHYTDHNARSIKSARQLMNTLQDVLDQEAGVAP